MRHFAPPMREGAGSINPANSLYATLGTSFLPEEAFFGLSKLFFYTYPVDLAILFQPPRTVQSLHMRGKPQIKSRYLEQRDKAHDDLCLPGYAGRSIHLKITLLAYKISARQQALPLNFSPDTLHTVAL